MFICYSMNRLLPPQVVWINDFVNVSLFKYESASTAERVCVRQHDLHTNSLPVFTKWIRFITSNVNSTMGLIYAVDFTSWFCFIFMSKKSKLLVCCECVETAGKPYRKKNPKTLSSLNYKACQHYFWLTMLNIAHFKWKFQTKKNYGFSQGFCLRT